jgi:hypothetical protein
MNGTAFDRLTRLFTGPVSRRTLGAVAGSLFLARPRPADAQQSGGCGSEGDVCTHLAGCCSGLVCATSFINASYGVCVPGEGEMQAVSSGLVVPGGDTVVAEMTAALAEAAATPGVDLAAQRQAVQSERRSKRRTRRETKRSKKRTRRTTQQNRRATRRGTDTTTTTDTG